MPPSTQYPTDSNIQTAQLSPTHRQTYSDNCLSCVKGNEKQRPFTFTDPSRMYGFAIMRHNTVDSHTFTHCAHH